jgi:predicted MPP superfamily phosphohydrolase
MLRSIISGSPRAVAGNKTAVWKIAITGNHEYYAGLDQAIAFTKEAGFTILRGEVVNTGVINIAEWTILRECSCTSKTRVGIALLAGLPKDQFTLLLKHRPVVNLTDQNFSTSAFRPHAQGTDIPFYLYQCNCVSFEHRQD